MDTDMTGGGGGGDEQDQAERLDESEIVADDEFFQDLNDDAMDDYPPDDLQGADEYGTTPQEERIDEPLDERERRYEPDPAAEIDPDGELDPEDRGPIDGGGPTGDPEALGLLDPVPGEPEEVPVDPMALEELGEDEHPALPGVELEAEVSTETEAYESEDPPYGSEAPS